MSKLRIRGCRFACGDKNTCSFDSETPGNINLTLQYRILTFFKIFKILHVMKKIWIHMLRYQLTKLGVLDHWNRFVILETLTE